MRPSSCFWLALCFILGLCAFQGGAQAPAPAPDCNTELISLLPCLDYVQGNVSAPPQNCCVGLGSVVRSNPICLCTLFNSSALPIQVNTTRALQLPGLCNVATPNPSLCGGSVAPVQEPVPSPAVSAPVPPTTAPTSPPTGTPPVVAPTTPIMAPSTPMTPSVAPTVAPAVTPSVAPVVPPSAPSPVPTSGVPAPLPVAPTPVPTPATSAPASTPTTSVSSPPAPPPTTENSANPLATASLFSALVMIFGILLLQL